MLNPLLNPLLNPILKPMANSVLRRPNNMKQRTGSFNPAAAWLALALLSVLSVAASPARAAIDFSFEDLLIDPVADGTTGTIDLIIVADAEQELTGITLDITVTPNSGFELQDTLASFPSGFDFEANIDTSNASSGEYVLAASSFFDSVTVPAGESTLLTANYELTDAGQAPFSIAISPEEVFETGFADITSEASGSPSTVEVVTLIPEPSSIALALSGAACLAAGGRRRARRRRA